MASTSPAHAASTYAVRYQRLPHVCAIEEAHVDQTIPAPLAGQPTLDIAALTLAAATGESLLGAAGMALFGVGTAPSLVAIALGGHALGHRRHAVLVRIAPVALAANAAALFWFAWRLLA